MRDRSERRIKPCSGDANLARTKLSRIKRARPKRSWAQPALRNSLAHLQQALPHPVVRVPCERIVHNRSVHSEAHLEGCRFAHAHDRSRVREDSRLPTSHFSTHTSIRGVGGWSSSDVYRRYSTPRSSTPFVAASLSAAVPPNSSVSPTARRHTPMHRDRPIHCLIQGVRSSRNAVERCDPVRMATARIIARSIRQIANPAAALRRARY